VRSFDVKGKQIKGEKKAIKLLETFEYLKSATTRLYDTEAKIICIVSKKGAQCGKSSVSCPLKPSDSAPLKHSTMPP